MEIPAIQSLTVHAIFAEVARRAPEAVALVDGDRSLTYGELHRRSNQWARHLQSLGVGLERCVGISMERSAEQVVALLAILKAGGAYVPLDPTYPRERLKVMLGDIDARVILAGRSALESLPPTAARLLVVEDEENRVAELSSEPVSPVGSPDNLAYVIFTSGSTGVPKGVEVLHRSIRRLVCDGGFVPLDSKRVVLQAAPVGFDASTFELWGPLLNGGRLVIHREPIPTPHGLGAAIRRHGVNTLWLTASLFNAVVDDDPAHLSGLEYLLTGGEALSVPHVARAHAALPGLNLLNGYGPTETTTFATTHRVTEADLAGTNIPIGRAIRETTLHLLDAGLRPVGAGQEGELFIGGSGVARGYRNRPELTASQFVTSPYVPGERLYRTGDRVRARADGALEFVARADSQVKIRGHRVELGEIELALSSHPAVRSARVLAREGRGAKRLVAYLVSAHAAKPPPGPAPLQAWLGERLPEPMIPSAFVWLPSLPLTANGKLDTRALPEPDRRRPELDVPYVEPTTAVERALCGEWSELLGIDRVGSRDNFFALGGTSLLAIQTVGRLRRRGIDIQVLALFEHPTAESLSRSLDGMSSLVRPRRRASESRGEGVAIVGMAGRFPGAQSVEELWQNLRAGRESISFFADAELDPSIPAAVRRDPAYVRARGVLQDADLFDAAFFGIQPKDAAILDPQQRILFEVAWEAMEHAGYVPERIAGSVGVFAGKYNDSYFANNVARRPELIEEVGAFQAMVLNEKDYVATHLAHRLDLQGPALSIHTACSTSLVAVAQAFDSLRLGHCDFALAGGASLTVPVKSGYLYQEGAMLSPDGHCRPFDADAQGTTFSDGVAMVCLKRLSDAVEDGDTIYGVIRGTATNNDGSGKASFTAPSVAGQAEVVRRAMEIAGLEPDQIGYVEAHGTATPLGDPIEVKALGKAFGTKAPKPGSCGLGSIKSNLGHTVIAAGAAGLIKVALSLSREEIPPTLHFKRANPAIDFASTPFRVIDKLTPWPRGPTPRFAGVSSFGVGGTNAHVIVEEPPRPRPPTVTSGPHVFPLSARTEPSLEGLTRRLATAAETLRDDELADVAFTLQSGRRAFGIRRSIVASTSAELAAALRQSEGGALPTGKPMGRVLRCAFLFPGQGAQYLGMGAGLAARFPLFRRALEEDLAALEGPLALELSHALGLEGSGQPELELSQTRLTQPALFLMEHALARLWKSWGVGPVAMVGHSVGEFVAATIAGVMAPRDAVRLVAARGQLMQDLPPGGMLSVRLSAEEMSSRLPPGVDLAADNAPKLCVVAGPSPAIEALESKLASEGVAAKRLATSHAFHSSMMDPAVARFRAQVTATPLQPPTIPFASTLTGQWITDAQATDPDYWSRHLRQPVLFRLAVQEVAKKADVAFVEVGPRTTLATLTRQSTRDRAVVASLGDRASPDAEVVDLLGAAGRLWASGVELDLAKTSQGSTRRRVPAPTYTFERNRYWIDAPSQPLPRAVALTSEVPVPQSAPIPAEPRSELLVRSVKELIEESSGNEIAPEQAGATFVEMGLDSLFLTQLALSISKKFKVKVTFRDLMERLPTLGALAAHLDQTLPAAAIPPAPSTPSAAPNVMRLSSGFEEMGAVAANAMAAGGGGVLQAVIADQLRLMARQLALLSGQEAPTALPVAMPEAAVAAPTSAPAPRNGTAAPGSSAAAAAEADVPKSAEPYDPKKAFGAIARITVQKTGELTARQKSRLDSLIQRYTARTAASKKFTQESRGHMADPRVVTGFRPQVKELVYPIAVKRSAGSKLWDLDGNEYVDALNGFGCNLFGWQPEFVTRALVEQLQTGHEIGPQTPIAAEVARLLCDFTGFDRAAFCNTGSEAVMGCMRIARTVTGRSRIAMFSGSYHGIFDEVIVRGTKKLKSFPAAPGIMGNTSENTLVLDYGTPESLEILRRQAEDLAAVLIEPIQSRNPELHPREFLHELREITQATGTVFIFDEVITGFRMGPGGAQDFYGLRADLASYGKVIGGGMPIGVIAGRRDLMDALDGGGWQFGDDSVPTVGVTYFAGTFVRHPLALAAVRAVLQHLKAAGPSLQEGVNRATSELVAELNRTCEQAQVPIRVKSFSSLWKIFYTSDQPFGDLLFYMMRDRGIHIYDGFPCFLTTAHTPADVEKIARAFKESVAEMQESGFLPAPTQPRGAQSIDVHSPPVPGARLGRDPQGNPAWYVPNPAEPGKFMKLGES